MTARGGTVLRAAQDSPYGRYAVVADPQGAAFSLMQTSGDAA
ncbi:VOC family protein [Klenkia terrae]